MWYEVDKLVDFKTALGWIIVDFLLREKQKVLHDFP